MPYSDLQKGDTFTVGLNKQTVIEHTEDGITTDEGKYYTHSWIYRCWLYGYEWIFCLKWYKGTIPKELIERR